jgi:hypothetical protein
VIGAICTQDILFHPFVTIQAFGWRVFFRSLFSGRETTFLSLLQQERVFEAPSSKEPELIERCVWLELEGAAIYHSLADRFADSVPLRDFFNHLADEEQEHADLLRVCKSFACKGRFSSQRFSPWYDYVPLLEKQMEEIANSLDKIQSADEAMRLVVRIEGSEINSVFLGVIQATDSPFVRQLGPFQKAVRHHIDGICDMIPEVVPSSAQGANELRAKFD